MSLGLPTPTVRAQGDVSGFAVGVEGLEWRPSRSELTEQYTNVCSFASTLAALAPASANSLSILRITNCSAPPAFALLVPNALSTTSASSSASLRTSSASPPWSLS